MGEGYLPMALSGLLNVFVFTSIFASIYALLSLGLNLQWGYTGLFNVGVAGFYAIGAYTSALLTTPLSPGCTWRASDSYARPGAGCSRPFGRTKPWLPVSGKMCFALRCKRWSWEPCSWGWAGVFMRTMSNSLALTLLTPSWERFSSGSC